MLYQLILLLITLVFVVRAHAAGTIGLPFGPGQTWTVCRGYNGPKEHSLAPVLDLTIGSNSVGTNGCIGDAWTSTGKEVVAPGDGTIRHFTSQQGASDGICIELDSGGALGILHFGARKVLHGARVVKGEVLGTLAAPAWFNGSYAHIHIQGHPGQTCQKGDLIPFTGNMRFQYHSDLPCDTFEEGKCTGRANQHSGFKLSNPAASTWHPAGTLIRAVDDAKVYFLQGGKEAMGV